METLVRTPGRVYSRYELVNSARGYEWEGYERVVDSHVKNLRRKLGDNKGRPKYHRDRRRVWLPLRPGPGPLGGTCATARGSSVHWDGGPRLVRWPSPCFLSPCCQCVEPSCSWTWTSGNAAHQQERSYPTSVHRVGAALCLHGGRQVD